MTRIAIIALACAALAACATADKPVKIETTAPKIETVKVEVPVPTSCVDASFPTSPPVFGDTPQALLAAEDGAQRDALVKGEYFDRRAWEDALWAQVQACR